MSEDHASKLKGFVWLLGACLLGAGFAVGLAPLAHAVPWSWEKKLGAVINEDGDIRSCPTNAVSEAALQKLVKRLYPSLPDDSDFSVDVEIVRDPVINAYASLGGKIMVTSALLKQAESPEEVAGVLAHEMGHVHHRHILAGMFSQLFTSQMLNMIFGDASSGANWASYFVSMEFTRSQEAEADRDGLTRLQAAHIDNKGFVQFFVRMEKTEPSSALLSDHPSNQDRIDVAKTFDNKNVMPVLSKTGWTSLKTRCGQD